MTRTLFIIFFSTNFHLLSATKSTSPISLSAPHNAFMSSLKSSMQVFESENVPYNSKPRQFIRFKTRVETKSMLIPSETMSLITQVSKSDLDQIVSKYTASTRQQQNCLVVRKYLDILPSTSSYYVSFWTRVWSWFTSSDPHHEMKSYRTMAYNILSHADYRDPSLLGRVQKKIRELKAMKITYFEKYYKLNKDEMDEKKESRKSTLEEIAETNQKVAELKTKMKSTERDINAKLSYLQKYVKTDAAKQFPLAKAFQKIDLYTNLKHKVDVASTPTEVDEVFSQVGYDDLCMQLKDKLSISQDFAETLESLKYLKQKGGLNKHKFEIVTDLISKMDRQHTELESQIEKIKKSITDGLKKKLKRYEDFIKSDKSFTKYKETVDDLIKLKKEFNHQKKDLNELMLDSEKKHLDLDTFNIREYSDFVLPSTVMFNLKAKYEKMKKIYTYTGMIDLKEARKTNKYARNPNLYTYTKYLASLGLFQTSLKKNLKTNVDKALKTLLDQMYLVGRIEDHEKFLDETLGNLFAEVLTMGGRGHCFTLSQLSFFMFNMFKTNVVANQHQFLIVFLSTLPFSQAREFVLYNYSLFSTKEFISNFERRFNTYTSKPNQVIEREEKYITQFAVNYLSLIDLYKDYTEFENTERALDQGGMFVTIWRSLGADLGRLLTEDVTEYVLGAFVEELVERIINLIPFIWAIPFLDAVQDYVVWTVSGFVTKQLMKLFGRFSGTITKTMNASLKKIKKGEFSLDYKKEISDVFNPEPPSTRANVSFKNLDKMFSEAQEDHSDVFFTAYEDAFFYRPLDATTTLGKLNSDVKFFNRYVLGDLIVNRLFKSGMHLSVSMEGVAYDLGKVGDYQTRSELFSGIYGAVSAEKEWRSYFFDLYQGKGDEVEQVEVKACYKMI